jgi:ribosomal protein S18 acetylase RimI-like enzyme
MVEIFVDSDNKRAIAFYEWFGFRNFKEKSYPDESGVKYPVYLKLLDFGE